MKNLNTISPFLLPLVCLTGGIYVQSIAPAMAAYFASGFCVSAGALVFMCLRFISWRVLQLLTLNALFLCAGGIVLHLQQHHTNMLAAQVTNRPLSLVATVTDKHVQVASKPRWKQDELLELAVTHVSTLSDPRAAPAGHEVPSTFNLQCFIKHTTKIQVGDTILLQNIVIKPPQQQTLSGNPGYTDYLTKEGFLASIFLPSSRGIQIIEHSTWTLRRWWWSLRNTTFQNVMTQLSPCTASYYSLIFLGKKDPDVTDQLRRTFNFWGLSHYLARSGIHIVLFILIWKFLLSLLPVHLIIKRLLLILICGSYGLLSWASTPFIRAFYSFLLTEVGRLFNYHVHFFHMLTIVCLLMLLFNPMQLFFLDFQLTFGLTFALGWLSLYIWKNTDTAGNKSIRPNSS
jgi:ComEC/Rec2-related protein